MLDIADKTRQPSREELSELCRHMGSDYQALCTIQYSGEQLLLGWNIRFHKAGKTLCTLYPRPGRFTLLLVVGQKEKPQVEALLPALTKEFQAAYHATREGMGQRWMLLEMNETLLGDMLEVIRIRRQAK